MKFILALFMALTVCAVCAVCNAKPNFCNGRCTPHAKPVCGVKETPDDSSSPYERRTFLNECVFKYEKCKEENIPHTIKINWVILHQGDCDDGSAKNLKKFMIQN